MPRSRITIDCKIRVEDEDRPFHYITHRFGRQAMVDIDVLPAAWDALQHIRTGTESPHGSQPAFLKGLFEGWGHAITRVAIKWLAGQWEPSETEAPSPHPEWEV